MPDDAGDTRMHLEERARGRPDPAPSETWTLTQHARDVDTLATALDLDRYRAALRRFLARL